MAEVPASGVRGPAFLFYLFTPLDSRVALWHRSQWEVVMDQLILLMFVSVAVGIITGYLLGP